MYRRTLTRLKSHVAADRLIVVTYLILSGEIAGEPVISTGKCGGQQPTMGRKIRSTRSSTTSQVDIDSSGEVEIETFVSVSVDDSRGPKRKKHAKVPLGGGGGR